MSPDTTPASADAAHPRSAAFELQALKYAWRQARVDVRSAFLAEILAPIVASCEGARRRGYRSRGVGTESPFAPAVRLFIERRCVPADTGQIRAAALYEAYCAWNASIGSAPPISQTGFGRGLASLGYRRRPGSNRIIWIGLQLRTDPPRPPSREPKRTTNLRNTRPRVKKRLPSRRRDKSATDSRESCEGS
jgi:hypothetical protein